MLSPAQQYFLSYLAAMIYGQISWSVMGLKLKYYNFVHFMRKIKKYISFCFSFDYIPETIFFNTPSFVIII